MMSEDELATATIKAAYKVRKTIGLGVLESVYEKCLINELKNQGIDVQKQEPEPLLYS
jgi:GxxExxY protein